MIGRASVVIDLSHGPNSFLKSLLPESPVVDFLDNPYRLELDHAILSSHHLDDCSKGDLNYFKRFPNQCSY